MRPSFIFAILLATAAAADLVNVLRRADAPGEPIIEKFAWPRASEVTGVDTSQYLRSPAKASGGTFSCTTKPGPNRVGCGNSIAVWSDLADDKNQLHVPANSCTSVTKECCRTVVCATKADLDVPLGEATGRMWNPLMIRCVLPGQGGVWQADDENMVVQVEYPRKGSC